MFAFIFRLAGELQWTRRRSAMQPGFLVQTDKERSSFPPGQIGQPPVILVYLFIWLFETLRNFRALMRKKVLEEWGKGRSNI